MLMLQTENLKQEKYTLNAQFQLVSIWFGKAWASAGFGLTLTVQWTYVKIMLSQLVF